eukprot:SAG11_NODE_23450_length_388_cov_1.065744_1_plen_72_part_01
MTDADLTISRELSKLVTQFKKCDANDDGKIDCEELRQCILVRGGQQAVLISRIRVRRPLGCSNPLSLVELEP